MKLLLSIFAALFLTGIPSIQADDAFADANRAYAQEHYAEAAQSYDTLLSARGPSVPILFNLANADAQLGQIGKAILYYKQAELLAPRDPDLAANLQHTLEKAGLPFEESAWERVVAWFSPNEWAWLELFALLIGCGALFRAYENPYRFHSKARIIAFLLLVGIVPLAGFALAEKQNQLRQVVALVPDAVIRISPFEEAKPNFSVPEGTLLSRLGSYDQFFLVKDDKGQSGWIGKDQAAPIVP